MKRILLLLLLATLAMPSFAAKKKASAKQAAPAVEAPVAAPMAATASGQPETPALTDKTVQFKAFSGSFIKYGNMSAGSRPFTLKVEFSPWFFEYTGKVNAAHNTADLDIYENEVIAVVAYHNAPGKTADGIAYQAGLFDIMIYLEDEPTRVSDASVKLVGAAAQDGSAAPVLAQAKTFAGLNPGQIFTDPANEKQLTAAQADALDKSSVQASQKAEQKRKADSLAAEKQRVEDSIRAEKQRVADSIKTEKLRVADSAKAFKKEQKRQADSVKAAKAEQKRLDDEAAAAAAAAKKKKKKKALEESSDDESVATEESEEPVVKKKKKKKKVVEESSDDESVAAEESEEPVVKKKKKKKKVVEEETSDDESVAAEESEEPVVKKKKKKKKKVVEEEAEEAETEE